MAYNKNKKVLKLFTASALSLLMLANSIPVLGNNSTISDSNETKVLSQSVTSNESDISYKYTNARVNFRKSPGTSSEIHETLNKDIKVEFAGFKTIDNDIDGWTRVIYNGKIGYIKSEYLSEEKTSETTTGRNVQLLEWSKVKNIFTTGVPAEVYDVRSGLTYYVKSFSNGLHADVEPATKEDTAIMNKTYGGRWSWNPRPVWVTINGYTIAGAINGMPHGGGVISGNGMSGQICLHFSGSSVHNGNRTYSNSMQAAVKEAWNAVK